MRLLVLQGPNLNLVTDRGRSMETLRAMLEARGVAAGAEVEMAQSNHEGELVDAVHHSMGTVDGFIVNAGVLAPRAEVLAEAIRLVGKPTVEVLLDAKLSKKSALRKGVKLQIAGKGFEGYLQAVDWLAKKLSATPLVASAARNPPFIPSVAPHSTGSGQALARSRGTAEPQPAPSSTPGPSTARSIGSKLALRSATPSPAKSIGRAQRTGSDDTERDGDLAASASRPRKTIGARPAVLQTSPRATLNRAAVRTQIAARLSGSLSPQALASWARTQWQQLQRGALVEAGERDLLDEVLQTLLLSSTTSPTDHQLIELMTRLAS